MILLTILRSIMAGIFFLFFTALMCSIGIIGAFFITNYEFGTWVTTSWAKVSLSVFGVDVKVIGLENIPAGSCLFLFNHTSFFDIFAMSAAYPNFRFGAKIELFQIPLLGLAMRRFGVLPIARGRREQVFKVYEQAKTRALNGEKFALSPEGGRSAEEKLLPFKAGPFIFAINSGMPLVPVVIKGAREILGKDQFLANWDKPKRTITVQYLPVVPVAGITTDQRSLLQQKVFEQMNRFF